MAVVAGVTGGLFASREKARAGIAVRGPRGGGAAVGVRRPGVGYRGPASPAGVVRRTTRRTARRMYALPRGYQTVVRSGVTYYYAGGVYYQPYYEGNTVVYVEVLD
jgi:hypothetical protein